MFIEDDLIKLASIGYLGGKSIIEFQNDILKLKSIKRQLIRYDKTNKVNVRLFLNNIILFFNCFNTKIAKEVIFRFLISDYHKSIVKTCLIYLSLMEEDELIEIKRNHLFDVELSIIMNESQRN